MMHEMVVVDFAMFEDALCLFDLFRGLPCYTTIKERGLAKGKKIRGRENGAGE